MASLTTLKLLNCYDCFSLAFHLGNPGEKSLALRSFELVLGLECMQYDWANEVPGVRADVKSFMDSRVLGLQVMLYKCPGLKDLFLIMSGFAAGEAILLNNHVNWTFLWHYSLMHPSSLRRLIIHERREESRACTGTFLEAETRGQWEFDVDIPWTDEVGKFISNPVLTCLGISMSASQLKSGLQSVTTRPNFKILHLRVSGIDKERKMKRGWMSTALVGDTATNELFTHDSKGESSITSPTSKLDIELFLAHYELFHHAYGGTRFQKSNRAYAIATNLLLRDLLRNEAARDFLSFAKWAFGVDGIPNLRILAQGDFSHNGRYSDQNIVLCKDDELAENGVHNFRVLRNTDIYYWQLIEENMDMLEACVAT